MSLRLAVLGATGRVGRLVVEAARRDPGLRLVAAPSRSALGPGAFADAEVVVDFSLPEALASALPHLGGAALVSGTTALPPEVQAAVDAHAARAPVLQAANFSPGVHVLLDLVARAASALPDHDLAIVEAHHRHKRDAPSGTGLALAQAAAAARGVPADGLALHAIRAGGIVGEHAVWLASAGEVVRLEHHATSREVFAEGALRAARWVAGRPAGAYTMRQVLFPA